MAASSGVTTDAAPLRDVAAVAHRLGIRVRAVYGLVETGQLEHYRLGRRLRFSDEQISRYLERSEVVR